ncbi:MAG: response regulator transcription factor [Propionibacteriaceae bacterium]|nr:response regulator transcription factor [Propionibacteriaceae bacterium]
MTTTLSIIVAEDSAILRDGLVALLTRRGHEVTGVPDGDALLAAVAARADRLPDVVVADIRMPPTHTDEGLRAALSLRRRYDGLPVLLFSQYVEAAYASQLLADGTRGVGYLLKDRVADVSDFVDALTRVAAGHTVLDPEVVAQLVNTATPADAGLASLTAREGQVLALMAEGRSNNAIGESLYLSAGAVEKHIAAIFTKLGLPADVADNRRVLAVLRYLGV